MSKSKDKQDPSVHYGPPPETWLWDLYPLAESAWGNILGLNDGSGDGNTMDMRRWLHLGQMGEMMTRQMVIEDNLSRPYGTGSSCGSYPHH